MSGKDQQFTNMGMAIFNHFWAKIEKSEINIHS